MRKFPAIGAAFLLLSLPALSQDTPRAGGGEAPIPTDRITAEQRVEIRSAIDQNVARLQSLGQLQTFGGAVTRLGWPLALRPGLTDPGYHGVSGFVDHNPATGALTDYNCGTRTYDTSSGYDHQGTDYFNWPFDNNKVATDDVHVVASAPGTIVFRQDGNPDQNCSFGQGQWNAIYVQHADGSRAWYGHLKNGSLNPKAVGQTVAEGEYLGVVASSGNSTGPHLHLEMYSPSGQLIDPYAGSCNSLNSATWWTSQRPYYDSAINLLMSGSAAVDFQPCPQQDITNEKTQFEGGERVFLTAFYRDQRSSQATTYTLRQPDGNIFAQEIHSSNAPHYAASYWWWSYDLPSNAQSGLWTWTALFQGVQTTTTFSVGAALPIELSFFAVEATDEGHLFSWATETETDNAGFELEMSRDDAPFERAAFVDGSGTTTSRTEYAALLKDLVVGKYQFRLRQIDLDGTTAVAGQLELVIEIDGPHLGAAYPNPASGLATLTYGVGASQHVAIELFDALGRKVKTLHSGRVEDAGSKMTLQVETGGLARGTYMVRMRGENFVVSRRLVVAG